MDIFSGPSSGKGGNGRTNRKGNVMPITERNFHLEGNYAPVLEEVTVTELRVTGFLPEQLNGHFIRNGPNPRSGESPHWFLGDGMLHGIRACVDNEISFTWVDADFLEKHEVAPWMHMTVWVPPVGEYAGFSSSSIQRALDAGLSFRPLANTAKATMDYWNSLSEERRTQPRVGLPAEKETEVLAAWHSKQK